MKKHILTAGLLYISVIVLLYGFTATAKSFVEELMQAVEERDDEVASNVSSSLASLKRLIREEGSIASLKRLIEEETGAN